MSRKEAALALLMGGEGTRMALGGGKRKPFVSIDGRQLVSFVLDSAHDAGLDTILAALTQGDRVTESWLGQDGRFAWSKVVSGGPGTAGAVRSIMNALGPVDHLLSVSDVVCSVDTIGRLLEAACASRHLSPKMVVAVTLADQNASEPINVELGIGGRVARMGKHVPTTGLTYGGIRWVSAGLTTEALFDDSRETRDSEALGRFCQRFPSSVLSCFIPDMFEVDTPADLKRVERWLRGQACRGVEK